MSVKYRYQTSEYLRNVTKKAFVEISFHIYFIVFCCWRRLCFNVQGLLCAVRISFFGVAGDRKVTCYGVSFDGKAAFPSVDRDIQVRELFSIGESGDVLQYSKNTYQNTESRIKLEGNLGKQFKTYNGSRQGHVRASGHFKAYINPCLAAGNASSLGFNIGQYV